MTALFGNPNEENLAALWLFLARDARDEGWENNRPWIDAGK